jgi:hypothetical protein
MAKISCQHTVYINTAQTIVIKNQRFSSDWPQVKTGYISYIIWYAHSDSNNPLYGILNLLYYLYAVYCIENLLFAASGRQNKYFKLLALLFATHAYDRSGNFDWIQYFKNL